MKNKVWGILFLMLAGAVILHEIKIIPDVPIFLIILTAFLSGWLFKSLRQLNFFGIIAPSTVLFILYNNRFEWIKIGTGTVILIAALTYFGLSLLFNRTEIKYRKKSVITSSSSDSFSAVFSESVHYITDKNLDELTTNCFMGELNLYFTESDMRGDTLTFNTSICFGSITLYVPRDWTVVSHATVIFGEIDTSPQLVSRGKILIIEGSVLFGEIDIKYI